MSGSRIHMIGNSHIDPVWLWDKAEGIDEVINTFKSACDRLDEYPFLHFTASSITFYKWVETHAPDVFERIKNHVRSGRWEIVGNWLVEADCNLPVTESFRKSEEISTKFTMDRFGIRSEVAYSPDTFGHPASLPTVMAETGYKYYIFSRPSMTEKGDLPGNLFYWEHRGNRILCQRLKYHYSLGPGWQKESVQQIFADPGLLHNGLGCFFFGVGDHGGGPTKTEVNYLHEIQESTTDKQLIFSTCRDYFKEAEKLDDIPTYSGDLHFHAVGCYSVNRGLKEAVRKSERELCYTSRILEVAGKDSAVLDNLWEKTVFNQFHDILPGSCSPEPYQNALNELGGVRDNASEIAYSASKELSAKIPTRCSQGEFRILNTLDHPITGPIEMESFMYFREGAPFKDENGNEIEIQQITPSVFCANRRWIFSDTLPAGSIKGYYFDDSSEPGYAVSTFDLYKAGESVENAGKRVEAPGMISNADSGSFFSSPVKLTVVKDKSDTWSHGVRGYGEAEGSFRQVSSTIYEGPIASYLLLRQEYDHSSADLQLAVYRDFPFVDMDIKVNWSEKQSILKMEIAPEGGIGKLFTQCAGDYVEKKTVGAEEPLHGWLLAGKLGIVQDGAFAFDRVGETLRLTLVRSSVFGFHDPSTIDYNGPVRHTDQGEHIFKFRFFCDDTLNPEVMDSLLASFIEPKKVMRENR